MTNKEKLATLKDYEQAEAILLLGMHSDCIQSLSNSYQNLDAIDMLEDRVSIIINWLKDIYDEEKGFAFYIEKLEYYKQLQQFDYLEGFSQSISQCPNSTLSSIFGLDSIDSPPLGLITFFSCFLAFLCLLLP